MMKIHSKLNKQATEHRFLMQFYRNFCDVQNDGAAKNNQVNVETSCSPFNGGFTPIHYPAILRLHMINLDIEDLRAVENVLRPPVPCY